MKILAAVLCSVALFAAEPKVIPLWPGAAPGSESWTQPEEEGFLPQTNIRIVRNVTRPTLMAYLPEASSANGTAVIVCPGGAFHFLSIDHEGSEVARWLNSLGVAAFVLEYRVIPTTEQDIKSLMAGLGDPSRMMDRMKPAMPLAVADGQQAVRIVRAHAVEWGIPPNRIAIMGFSAGGYVTAAVALQHDAGSRPNFAAPIYPATPDDISVPADAPPLFLAHADDDRLVSPIEHSVRLYSAWKKAGFSAELHIYSRGGHGFGMRKSGLPVDTWPDRLRDWLDVQGLLKPTR